MIKIATPNLEELAQKHYEALKSKIKDFTCKYSLEEVITAKPDKLHEIAMKYKNDTSFDFMKNEYKKFTIKTDNDTYDAYTLAQALNVTVCPYCNPEIIRLQFDLKTAQHVHNLTIFTTKQRILSWHYHFTILYPVALHVMQA